MRHKTVTATVCEGHRGTATTQTAEARRQDKASIGRTTIAEDESPEVVQEGLRDEAEDDRVGPRRSCEKAGGPRDSASVIIPKETSPSVVFRGLPLSEAAAFHGA